MKTSTVIFHYKVLGSQPPTDWNARGAAVWRMLARRAWMEERMTITIVWINFIYRLFWQYSKMAQDNRRCTASQFFMQEEEEALANMSTYDRVRIIFSSIIAQGRVYEESAVLMNVLIILTILLWIFIIMGTFNSVAYIQIFVIEVNALKISWLLQYQQ